MQLCVIKEREACTDVILVWQLLTTRLSFSDLPFGLSRGLNLSSSDLIMRMMRFILIEELLVYPNI